MSATGPDLHFSVTLTSPGYVFATETGNATLTPYVKLEEYCSGSSPQLLSCDVYDQGPAGSMVGFRSGALAAGTYDVVADSWPGSSGQYDLVVSLSGTLGDKCNDARALALNGTTILVAGDTGGFAADDTASCGANSSPDALFSFAAPRSGMLSVTLTPGVALNGSLAAYSGPSCAAKTEIGCADAHPTGVAETLAFSVSQGATYWLRVASSGTLDTSGSFTLQLDLP
jgi:hypothetical protein